VPTECDEIRIAFFDNNLSRNGVKATRGQDVSPRATGTPSPLMGRCFWLWKCASLQEAIEWIKRCPNPMSGEEAEIEIRQVFEPEDFSPEPEPE